MENSSVS